MSYTDNKYFATLAGPWGGDMRPQLFYVKKQMTDTRRTEVHVLSAASDYKDYILHKSTGLHQTFENFVFKLADWDGDGIPDLWAIKKWDTGTGKTEVHIYSGASDFAQPIFHGATAQGETGANFEFDILPRGISQPPDLVLIQRSGTGSGTTEVHILSGASEFREYSLHTETGLHETGTGDEWAFAMADLEGDGMPDLVAITAANGGELHSLQGPDYKQFNRHLPFNESNASQVLNLSGSRAAMVLTCAAAALDVAKYYLAGPLGAPVIAVTWGITYIKAITCYTMAKQYMRVVPQPSGQGGRGDDGVREWPDRPPPPSDPGGVSPPHHPPPGWEPDPAERPFDPGPPPGPRGPDPWIGV